MTPPARAARRRLRDARRTVAAAVLLAAVAGCAPSPPDDAATRRGDGVLRVVTGSDLTSTGIRRELIERAAAATGVEVEVVELPDDADRQRSQLVAELQSGNRDGYDIVNLDVTWTAEFAEQGLIEPLDGELGGLDRRDATYIWPSVRETVEYRDTAWAVPWNTDVGLLYYRADRLGTDPPLRTWRGLTRAVDDYEPAADGPDDARGPVGMVTQLAPYEGLTVNTFEAVWRNGGEIIDAEGEVRVTEDEARSGLLELARAFATSGGRPVLDKEWARSDETGAVERFLAGEALTMRNWPFAKSRLEEHARKSAEDGGTAPRFGVTALPGAEDGTAGSAALGGQNLAIAKDSPDRDDAAEVIDWLTGAAAGAELYEGGFVPARADALPGDCRRETTLPARVPRGSFDEQYQEALCWSMAHARARPVTPYYAAVTQDIQDVVAKQLRAAPTGPPVESRALPEDLRDRLRSSLDGH